MLLKCFTQYASKFGILSSGHRTGKGQFSFQFQRKAMPKNAQTTTIIALISHASKVMFKILQPGFNSMLTMNFQMFKLDLEKAEEPEIKLPTSVGSSKKQENSRKTSTSVLLTMPKPLTVWITINCGKFSEMGIPDHPTCLLRNVYAGQETTVKTGHGATTGSKSGKEYVKAVYCHPAYLTYMQSTSWDMLDWMKHKLESRLPGEISITSDIRWHHPYGRKWRTKEPLDESERGE